MKVGIREFRNNISEYLSKLPITLTKRGKPFAVIHPLPKEAKTHKSIGLSGNGSDPQQAKFVEAHQREKGKKYQYMPYLGKYREES